jgi:O-antigen biosynthesis protein
MTDLKYRNHKILTEMAFMEPLSLAFPPAWIEHIPLAFWIVEALKPRLLVELGTHSGNSYLAFCQAVLHLRLPTRCFAVDTWKGDEQAGFYGEEVFEVLSRKHDPIYGGFSSLVQSTFDEARETFLESSIDLLHIDGCHTYEAVKRDFESWRSKLSDRGVVIFHDTNVRQNHFGVFRLWEEIASQFPSFEFFHGHGLGVAGIGPHIDAPLARLFAASKNEAEATQIRSIFACLGRGLLNRFELEQSRLEISDAIAKLQNFGSLLAQERAQGNAFKLDLARERVRADQLEAQLAQQIEKEHVRVERLQAELAKQVENARHVETELAGARQLMNSGRWLLRTLAKKLAIRAVGEQPARSIHGAWVRLQSRK